MTLLLQNTPPQKWQGGAAASSGGLTNSVPPAGSGDGRAAGLAERRAVGSREGGSPKCVTGAMANGWAGVGGSKGAGRGNSSSSWGAS